MKTILSAAVALSMLASAGAVSAAPNDHRQDQRVEQLHRQADRADRKADRAQDRYERQAAKRYSAGRYQRPQGYQQRRWAHGDRLPAQYRSRAYVVDYNRYHLAPPPRGYQYTRVDNDVVLTAVATGVIASVIVGLFQ
jgi:Ni/Co efflux regulator RcnB